MAHAGNYHCGTHGENSPAICGNKRAGKTFEEKEFRQLHPGFQCKRCVEKLIDSGKPGPNFVKWREK